jgi:hypothetical protein
VKGGDEKENGKGWEDGKETSTLIKNILTNTFGKDAKKQKSRRI